MKGKQSGLESLKEQIENGCALALHSLCTSSKSDKSKQEPHLEDVEEIDAQILNNRGLLQVFQLNLRFDERNLNQGQDTVGFAQMSTCD